jgi:hypothetical protein
VGPPGQTPIAQPYPHTNRLFGRTGNFLAVQPASNRVRDHAEKLCRFCEQQV